MEQKHCQIVMQKRTKKRTYIINHLKDNRGDFGEKLLLISMAFVIGAIFIGILLGPSQVGGPLDEGLSLLLSNIVAGKPIINAEMTPAGMAVFVGELPNGLVVTHGDAARIKRGDVRTGDTIEYRDYEYKYNAEYNYASDSWVENTSLQGWGVRVRNTELTSYDEMYGRLFGKYVKSLAGTFAGCTQMTTSPKITDHITNINGAFYNCSGLTDAPIIPSCVTSMRSTFENCTKLTGTVRINARLTTEASYAACFAGTIKNIALVGSCSKLADLQATSTNSNVTIS